MTEIKAFVRPDNTAAVICPVCKIAKQVSAEPYRHKKQTLKIRCTCDTTYTVQLDFRHHYRKQTGLSGTYRVLSQPGKKGGVINIENISRSGIGFTVSGQHEMQKGQTLQLEFRLNDKNQTKLTKQAYIRTINNNFIGCQFVDQNPFDKTLGFYLHR